MQVLFFCFFCFIIENIVPTQNELRVFTRPRPEGHDRGRVEDWRADFRLRWVFHTFRGGPQSGCHDHVSSPRRIERSVRFARTTLTCALRTTAYGTYATETTFRRSRRNR